MCTTALTRSWMSSYLSQGAMSRFISSRRERQRRCRSQIDNRHASGRRRPARPHGASWRSLETFTRSRTTLDPLVLMRSENRLQRWAVRAIAAFLAVYMLGMAGVPTFVPYVAVLLAVIVDGVRLALQTRVVGSKLESDSKRGGRETIH